MLSGYAYVPLSRTRIWKGKTLGMHIAMMAGGLWYLLAVG